MRICQAQAKAKVEKPKQQAARRASRRSAKVCASLWRT